MDPVLHEVAECRVDRALPLKPVHCREGGGFDLHGEVAFATAVMTGMAAMPVAVVDHLKPGRSERFAQAFLDFGGDRSG